MTLQRSKMKRERKRWTYNKIMRMQEELERGKDEREKISKGAQKFGK